MLQLWRGNAPGLLALLELAAGHASLSPPLDNGQIWVEEEVRKYLHGGEAFLLPQQPFSRVLAAALPAAFTTAEPATAVPLLAGLLPASPFAPQ